MMALFLRAELAYDWFRDACHVLLDSAGCLSALSPAPTSIIRNASIANLLQLIH